MNARKMLWTIAAAALGVGLGATPSIAQLFSVADTTAEVAAPARAEDQDLAERVRDALAGDLALDGLVVIVRANHGTVLLSGLAQYIEQAERAVALTLAVPGVASVRSSIQVS